MRVAVVISEMVTAVLRVSKMTVVMMKISLYNDFQVAQGAPGLSWD